MMGEYDEQFDDVNRSLGTVAHQLERQDDAIATVLAQASAYVGAVFTGIWAWVLAHVWPAAVDGVQAAGGDTVTAVIGVVCGLGLVAAALWLESVCRVPPDDEQPPGGVAA